MDAMTLNGMFRGMAQTINDVVQGHTSIKKLAVDVMSTLAEVDVNVPLRPLLAQAGVSQYQGSVRAVAGVVNQTVGAVISPLIVVTTYIDTIAKGIVPATITDIRHGDFTTLQNNLTTCVGAVNTLVADLGLLARATINDGPGTRAGATQPDHDLHAIADRPPVEVTRVVSGREQSHLTQAIAAEPAGALEDLMQFFMVSSAPMGGEAPSPHRSFAESPHP
jgi:hypothetical protein